MATLRVELSQPQLRFVGTSSPHPCFCGGFGAGKTEAGVIRALVLKLRYPDLDFAQYLPTFDLVRHIALPRFEQRLDELKIRAKVNRSDATIRVANRGRIIFRTMDTPERIIGFEVADSCADELDTLKPLDAADVWRRILSRNRQKKPDGAPNTAAVTTTPEGFRFVYETWGKVPKPGYELIRASTASNARNLPVGYADSLKAQYPSNLLLAYLEGHFVNLTSGSVYHEFSRTLNATTETIKPAEALHIGMDFNVGKMAAVVYVLRNDEPHAVAEHVDVFDTPAMAALLTKTYRSDGKNHPIIVYPDASGNSRKSVNASESDIAILKQAKFQVFVNPRNPAVKDRVLATNAQIHKDGRRRLKVNPDTCPHLVEAFEKQAYDKNGEPDKSAGLDHVIDAATYPVAYRWPIEKRTATVQSLRM